MVVVLLFISILRKEDVISDCRYQKALQILMNGTFIQNDSESIFIERQHLYSALYFPQNINTCLLVRNAIHMCTCFFDLLVLMHISLLSISLENVCHETLNSKRHISPSYV